MKTCQLFQHYNLYQTYSTYRHLRWMHSIKIHVNKFLYYPFDRVNYFGKQMAHMSMLVRYQGDVTLLDRLSYLSPERPESPITGDAT